MLFGSSGFFCLIVLLSCTKAFTLPQLKDHLLPRQTVDCNDVGGVLDGSCWQELGLSDYLTHWNQTTPVCQGKGPGTDGSACCVPGEPWTTCFLRIAHGHSGADCSEINSQKCSFDPTLSQSLDASIRSKVHYVVATIYAVNDFFGAWYTALQYATTNTQLALQPVINELDPAKVTNSILGDILTALSAGLALIPGIGAGVLGIDAATVAAGNALLAGIQQVPGVAKAIWPAGTADSKSIQLGALDQALATGVQNLSSQFNSALELLMSDVPSFVGFSQSGAFSGQTSLSIPKATEGLTVALNTYILSLAMEGNGYGSEYWYNASAEQFQKGYAVLGCAGDLKSCACTLDANSLCQAEGENAWYWNPTNSHIFQLRQGKGPKPGVDLMTDIVNNKWTSLGLLFDSGFNCTVAGGSQTPITLNPDGTLNMACISQLKMTCPVHAGIGDILGFAPCTPDSNQAALIGGQDPNLGNSP